MSTTIKLSTFCITTMILFFLFIGKANAQSCEDSFYQARGYYYKGQFDVIPKLLASCVSDFDGKNEWNYKGRNLGMVFRVYKLITSSYYQMDLDYEAEKMEDELINYLEGIMDSNVVLERLAYTKF